jgi:hypothetical protein
MESRRIAVPISLKPFDPSRQFVTATAFRAGGIAHGRGCYFKKSLVNERVLRLLYEQRKIIYDDDPRAIKLLTVRGPREPAKAAPASDEGRKPVLSEAEQVEKLMAQNSKADLLEKAKQIPGVNRAMNKAQLATALVRSGHGDS